MTFKEFVWSKGITQTQLADAMGYGRAHISKWANGDNFPTPKSINKMVDGFARLGKSVTYDELFAVFTQAEKEKGA
jgi:transcriptional regulator with XRE-family HTH domain